MRKLKSIFFSFLTTLSLICGTSDGFASDGPRFDMNSSGNAITAWLSYVSGGAVIQANFKAGTSWDTPVAISDVNSSSIDYPVVKVVPTGTDIQGAVIWSAYNSNAGVTSLYAAMLPSSSDNWTNSTQISSDDENIVSPQYDLRVNANGNVVAIWSSYDSSNNQYVRSSTSSIDFSNAWSTPVYTSGP